MESTHSTDIDVDSRLIAAARPVIEHLSEQVVDLPACVALTDSSARILVRRDSSHWIGRILDRVYFAEGFGYAESSMGTNGVGTVLESGRSVHIVGAEHFVETLQSFACAGAPIRDPFTGRIEGVLDITCLGDHSSPIMHSLARSAAARIERNLLADRDVDQQTLFDAYARLRLRTRDGVVVVGRGIVIATTRFQQTLEAADQAALCDYIRFLTSRGSIVDEMVTLPSGARPRLRGSPVSLSGEVIGMAAVVTVNNDRELDVSAPARSRPAPDPCTDRSGGYIIESTSPALRSAALTIANSLDRGAPVVVFGEAGSGRCRMLETAHRSACPDGVTIRLGPRDLQPGSLRGLLGARAQPALIVLTDIDRLSPATAELVVDALAADGRPRRLAATAGATEATHAALLRIFRESATVPALRHRRADIPQLATALLRDLAPHREVRLSPDALRVLGTYQWPGNIRELREALSFALDRRPVGMVDSGDLPAFCHTAARRSLRRVEEIERDTLVVALRETGGNRKAAAAMLGLARSTLYRKIRYYGIVD